VVVVGHSLGGLTIPLVAARRPVAWLVYLCAFVPIPGRSHVDQLRLERDALPRDFEAGLSPADDQGRRRWVDEAVARRVLYPDCEARDAAAAFERLRPQARAPYDEPCPLEAFPAVPSTYVVCAEDRVANPEWGCRVARGRLGAELVELPGGHSPFLSRPSELAAVLLG
jgi:pimeloyl-ACP methyl ester carboxylesterase